jgi:hypothetical protein
LPSLALQAFPSVVRLLITLTTAADGVRRRYVRAAAQLHNFRLSSVFRSSITWENDASSSRCTIGLQSTRWTLFEKAA